MDLGRFLIETHLRTGRPIKELARAHGVSASWLFKLKHRALLDGPDGLVPKSRRPHTSPTRVAHLWEEQIVALRKQLLDFGTDAGAETIHVHLTRRHDGPVPSTSTIWRVLQARGFITPQPQKRPKSSYTRFAADLPNECWQADVTHVALASGLEVEILHVLDDHSRLAVAARAMLRVKATDVIRVLHTAAETYGYPASFLTDNGLIFTGHGRYGLAGAVEHELFALGIGAKHSRPYHPQTCGKVERFHQTVKRYLAAQDPIATKRELQRHLDRFIAYYNHSRPHRSLSRRTPAAVYHAREKARPAGAVIATDGRRLRFDRVDKAGLVTLRHRGRLHHIGVGRPYTGWRVAMLIDGTNIEIVSIDGHPLRRLVLDPTQDYQPQN